MRTLRDLARGESIVLLRPSGSGKSTLLDILGGLDVPSAGQVLFGTRGPGSRRDRCGMRSAAGRR